MRRIGLVALTSSERQRRYHESHKNDPAWLERKRAKSRASYRRNKSKSIARSQRWAGANRERTQLASRSFYWRNVTDERLRVAEKTRRRRALMLATAVEPIDYSIIVRDSLGICAICDGPVINEPAHIDHIVPLAEGGTHTYNNLQFTHARCNLAKGAKLLKKVG
jgi:5-methylcytosine-specific restriction endonuclease McrA